MKKNTSEKRTLLLSVLMSTPGPLIVGIGLIIGKSSTQLADFVRRSAELVGLISAYVTYTMTTKDGVCDTARREELERKSNILVGTMMFLAGTIMFILSFLGSETETGNVIPGLAVAVLGVIANILFWRKYKKLNIAEPNPIIAVQVRLYRAKSLVDSCITLALTSLLLMPGTRISAVLDTVGSAIVAAYLAVSGMRTILDAIRRQAK